MSSEDQFSVPGEVWRLESPNERVSCQVRWVRDSQLEIQVSGTWFAGDMSAVEAAYDGDESELYYRLVDEKMYELKRNTIGFDSVVFGEAQGDSWTEFSAYEVEAFLKSVRVNPLRIDVVLRSSRFVLGEHLPDMSSLSGLRLKHSSLPHCFRLDESSANEGPLFLEKGALQFRRVRIDSSTSMTFAMSGTYPSTSVQGDSIVRMSSATPGLEIVCTETQSIDVLKSEYLDPISAFLGFCGGGQGTWTSIGKSKQSSLIDQTQLHIPIAPSRAEIVTGSSHFHLNHLGEGLDEVVQNWFKLFARYRMAIDYGLRSLSEAVSSVQAREASLALEGLSSLATPYMKDRVPSATWKPLKIELADVLERHGCYSEPNMTEISKAVRRPALFDRIYALARLVDDMGIGGYSDGIEPRLATLVTVRNTLSHVDESQEPPPENDIAKAAAFAVQLFRLVVLGQLFTGARFDEMAESVIERRFYPPCCGWD